MKDTSGFHKFCSLARGMLRIDFRCGWKIKSKKGYTKLRMMKIYSLLGTEGVHGCCRPYHFASASLEGRKWLLTFKAQACNTPTLYPSEYTWFSCESWLAAERQHLLTVLHWFCSSLPCILLVVMYAWFWWSSLNWHAIGVLFGGNKQRWSNINWILPAIWWLQNLHSWLSVLVILSQALENPNTSHPSLLSTINVT